MKLNISSLHLSLSMFRTTCKKNILAADILTKVLGKRESVYAIPVLCLYA